MRNLKTIIGLCIIGLPLFCFSQKTKKTDIDKLNISVELDENWNIKNSNTSKYVFIENKNLKTSLKIQSSDFKKAHDKIFKNKDSKCAENNLNSLYNFKENENYDIHVSFSISNSEVKKDVEIITLDKILNKNAYLIKANIPKGCEKCKDEFEIIVSSIREI
ncbi:hypothetical protein [Flavivirga algicola]|uniref:Uncharacterized protein n=1 Tax=Flavivirga algicola TaxID=2729136 RepID=A0ABX1RYY8_9FLAO|nr:hypothetical protein [Flavivirga algicola]NMH87714.1 hypothetical protein [Flavivirga algicola]